MARVYRQSAVRTSSSGLELTPQPAHASPPPRILIIEDELLVALMIEEMCREMGYRVSGVAHTAEMARDEMAKRNFDAVLLDVSLAGQHQYKTAELLMAAGIPFAFVTGYDYLVDPRHAQIPVLQKPFGPAQLYSFLEALIGADASCEQRALIS
jgi:DNA-binding response OmpR family regulator